MCTVQPPQLEQLWYLILLCALYILCYIRVTCQHVTLLLFVYDIIISYNIVWCSPVSMILCNTRPNIFIGLVGLYIIMCHANLYVLQNSSV